MNNLVLVFVIIISSFLTSCKKNNDVNDQSTLIGTWENYQFGLDSNKNNVVDVNELKISGDIRQITFKTDNTFQVTSAGGSDNGTYTYINDTVKAVYSVGFPFEMYIHSITKDRMISKGNTYPDMWNVYKRKQ